MKLLLVNSSGDRVQKAWLERWLRGLARQLARRGFKGLSRKELVVVFVSGREMRRLNRFYRGKDRTTDVLSFAPAEESSLGELVLCLPVLRRQCRMTGLTVRGELGYMIVHGVLHLLGFDHVRSRQKDEMFALQDEIFSNLMDLVGFKA
jgi:probable rRNA maturation factor